MNEGWIRELGRMALEAMLYELAATPKPGLVDRANNGAHCDMDFFTFLSSSASLRDAFDAFAHIGLETADAPACEALADLRAYGRKAEERMFESTGAVNTHKGMIFSLGLICGAAGRIGCAAPLTMENICACAAELAAGICDRDFFAVQGRANQSKGEQIYFNHGISGARGEAESGFATVRQISYPVLRQLLDAGTPINDALVQTLLHFIANVADTNIIARHGLETADWAKQKAAETLRMGGWLSPEGQKQVIDLDKEFIRRNISPGGCADLLAVTLLLYRINQEYGRPV